MTRCIGGDGGAIELGRVRELHMAGKTQMEIASLLEYSQGYISAVMKEMGLGVKRGRPFREIDMERVRELRSKGYTMARIGIEMGVSGSTISRRLNNARN